MENTPVDIKLSLPRRIFDQNEENPDPKLPFYIIDWATKNISRYCPFKGAQAKRTRFVFFMG
jgi:hypothetical protein